MKKLFIKTYGCQMNVYDSDRMSDVLAPLGYVPHHAPEDADMVILNTCHIREKASEKVFSELGRLRQLKERARDQIGRDMMITVAGCVAQAEGAEITRRAPWVDMVVGPQSYHRLPELIAKLDPGARNNVIDTDMPEEVKFDFLPEEVAHRGPAAFLSVQEGCDKFCAFCVVPYTRGAEFSRNVAQVVEETKKLVANGTKEITLLGQNVNAYHGEGPDGKIWGLGRLLHHLAEIDGVERLRYTTSHPLDMDDELIYAHRDIPALMPYLHLPVQAGSDHVLDAMNRRHTADDYKRIIGRLRDVVPNLALSGDFIVGFPGETDQDFEDTLDLVRKVKYGSAYSFKYSPRPGTTASERGDAMVDPDVASKRLARLQALLTEQQYEFQNSMVGKTVDVLFERKGRIEGQMVGKSEYLHAVHVMADDIEIGDIRRVEITHSVTNSLAGRLVK